MPQRVYPEKLKLLRGKLPRSKRGRRGTIAGPESQTMPRAPKHFSEAERQAWKDILRPIVDRGAWRDDLRLWVESYATLLAVTRGDDRHENRKINRSILRLYSRDLIWMIDHAPNPVKHNPFADF